MAKEHPRTLQEFERHFGDEVQCQSYLFALRWPQGFVCPACGAGGRAIRRHLWRCVQCGRESSVVAGTVFQDSKLPLKTWFQAMWEVTSQQKGISALGLQRVLGLGNYKTAWALLHKLRRAMAKTGPDRLSGVVEVDEAYWGTAGLGRRGLQFNAKALILVAVQADGKGIDRIRLQRVPDTLQATLHSFIVESVEPGSTVVSDGLQTCDELADYIHERRAKKNQAADVDHLLPRAHRVILLLKRWLLRTHQGAIAHEYLQDYLDEFAFRFNRRKATLQGNLFCHLVKQAVQTPPVPFSALPHRKL